MEFESVIKTRESIRNYSATIVEDEKINYVIECARRAPSCINRQCWRFIVACGDTRQSCVINDINLFILDAPVGITCKRYASPRERGSESLA